MSQSYDCLDPEERTAGLAAAVAAIGAAKLVVLPTDTVYGIGADAFSADAVADLLAAKGRGRDMPVPVLIGAKATLDGIAAQLSDAARELVEAFWPGGLTLLCRQQPSLIWDLGDARGTVAVRMPQHPLAIELLSATGPMAVSSANITGRDPATDLFDAMAQLGESVQVYLDSGPTGDCVPSSIVDVTGARPRLLRGGAVSTEALLAVVPNLDVIA